MKYDDGHPFNRMSIRALITAAVVLVSSLAEGQSLISRAPWHAVVTPPRPELPTVAIDLGYPGPYVPTQNFPITLHATAGDLPFNGYIGFHFRVKERPTHDTRVVARALLRPHETWTFSTYTLREGAGLHHDAASREIAIEWRDASMNVSAVRNAGAPPWTPWTTPLLPLRIGARTTAEPSSALGRSAYSERAGALPDRAQWYAGFSDVVAPVEVWLDLPRRVREAVLGSGINVVVFGLPRSGQKLDDLDGPLLPVTFEAKPGSYRAPWPYGNSSTVATPLSWVMKDGATGVGNGPLPYMVRSAVATWVADENGVSHPLPATAAMPILLQVARNRSSEPDRHIAVAWPRPAQFLRLYPALPLTLVAGGICLAGWLILRRRPRAAMTVALLISATFVLAARERIRPPSGVYRYDVETTLSPGIVGRLHLSRAYGSSPLPEYGGDPETMRTSITSAWESWQQNTEVRTSSTPVSMGVMSGTQDWNAVTRSSSRRERGGAPLVRIRSREGKTLVLDYESAQAINYVYAEWLCGENLCWGETAVRPGTHGSATIRNGHRTWPDHEPFASKVAQMMLPQPASRTRVSLVQKTRTHTRIVEWLEPAANRQSGSFLITDRQMLVNGSGNFAFALPREVSPTATVLVSLTKNRPSVRVKLVWATGSAMLAPTGRNGLPSATRSYLVPPEALREILVSGGIVNVTMSSDPRAINPFDAVSIEVWEKKP